MKKYTITESQLKKLINKQIVSETNSPEEQKENKPRCVPENTIPLDEIVGKADEYTDYAPGVSKRKKGVYSFVDTLGILNNLRVLKDIKDGGAHLAYDMMHHLNKFRNKNYYDETSGQCHKAMDKIIELYKENEHGTELVKDIEKVLALQTKDDQLTPSARTKEYLKRALELTKGK
jgi:hypothetical protein